MPSGLVGMVGLFAVWEAASRSEVVPSNYLVPPSIVLPTMVSMLGDIEFLRAVIATVLAAVIALAIAVAVAVPAGLVLGSVPAVRRAAMTLVEFLRPIPSVALIPLAMMTFGTGPETKITLAVYAAVWPILFNTIYALDELDPLHVDTARAFGTSRVGVLTRVALPSAAPFVLTGVRLSAAMALAVVVSTELLSGGTPGIGRYIMVANSSGSYMDEVLAGTVLAGLIGYAANAGLERLHRRLFSWSTPKGVDQ
ncbi:nitrate ABC transporter permease [Actinokineospora fastidiosa]|uniref:Nitrate ABC transporter permease n=1 Tax=Actinokineospora fastidiosa TaxID=1816 RepID=A0A918G378_9PSEU|nr:Bicarbonate transport system permease protein CmpB [Actinokineospora sp. UTMC 2448]GGS15846.1 nitrate ABC transporter permease [Actinokineospora fastidiosa]